MAVHVISVCSSAFVVVVLSVPVDMFVFAAVGIAIVVGVCSPFRW